MVTLTSWRGAEGYAAISIEEAINMDSIIRDCLSAVRPVGEEFD